MFLATRFLHRLRFLNDILWLPEVTIRLSGSVTSKEIFNYFTKPHPKYKLVQNKRWGVALLPLPDRFEEYFDLASGLVQRKRQRAIKLGFHFDSVNPLKRLDEILSINSSLQVRQGKPVHPDYLNVERLQVWAEDKPMIYGVLDANHVLKAYACVPICGEVFIFSRLLGHAGDLDKGIMYLLISEVIREMIDHRLKKGVPLWAMYDTFFGGLQGLRYFKERLGFKPHKVKWLWEA